MKNGSKSLQAVVDKLQNELAVAHARILALEGPSIPPKQFDASASASTQAYKSARTREAALHQTEEIAKLGHEIWDHAQEKTLFVSEELAKIYGLSVDEYMLAVQKMEDYFKFVVPEDREAYKEFENQFQKEESFNPLSIEYRVTRTDGKIRHLRQSSKLIPAEFGPPTQSLNVIQDITRFKQVEAELQRSRDALEESTEILALSASIANLGHAVWDYDYEKFLLVSDSWASCFGLTQDDFLEIASDFDHYLLLVHPGDRERYTAYYYDESDFPQIDYRIIHSNGETRYVEQHYMLREQSGLETAVVTIQDVTENKKAEAQLIQSSKLITLGEMSAGMAHELNQPLNVIVLAAENAARKISQGTVEQLYLMERLERIVAQAKRASTIINHLRTFGREAKEDFYEVDLRKAAVGSLELMGEQLRLAQVEVETNFDDDFPLVMGHQIQLEQMFINLYSNAFHAIKKNDPEERTILIEAFKSREGEATIRVSDTGGGIPDSVLPNIFDPFYTTKSIEEGTGLGLSVSYGFVLAMGGTIAASNTELGVCFEIKIPPAIGDGISN